MSNKCSDCGRALRASAIKCVCGWSVPSAVAVEIRRVACCYSTCSNGALCRVWTKTGWANVCVSHYSKIELAPRPKTDNPYMSELRAAYENSPHYLRTHGGKPADKHGEDLQLKAELDAMREKMSRIPGADDDLALGIPRDALEQELMDEANP